MSNNKTSQLMIRLSEDDHEQIQMNAKACDKTVSAYIREMALNFCVLDCNYEKIIDHTHEITSLRNAVNQLVYTIKKSGEYVPADLEYILAKMNDISKSENNFVNIMLDEKEKKTKAIAKEVRKLVREKLKEINKK